MSNTYRNYLDYSSNLASSRCCPIRGEGPTGIDGAIGAVGPLGLGIQGVQGPEGITGPQGPQGYQGPGGTSGEYSGFGNANLYYGIGIDYNYNLNTAIPVQMFSLTTLVPGKKYALNISLDIISDGQDITGNGSNLTCNVQPNSSQPIYLFPAVFSNDGNGTIPSVFMMCSENSSSVQIDTSYNVQITGTNIVFAPTSGGSFVIPPGSIIKNSLGTTVGILNNPITTSTSISVNGMLVSSGIDGTYTNYSYTYNQSYITCSFSTFFVFDQPIAPFLPFYVNLYLNLIDTSITTKFQNMTVKASVTLFAVSV